VIKRDEVSVGGAPKEGKPRTDERFNNVREGRTDRTELDNEIKVLVQGTDGKGKAGGG